MGGIDLVTVNNLTKRFKDFPAVDGISFSVREGEMFAFLGPNGAGKTTTIKMLITLLSPTSGEGIVCGYSITNQPAKVRRVIGYVPQLISVDGTLTAYENLKLMAQLYDTPRHEREGRVREVLEFLRLKDHANALVRTFSGGMIRNLEVGQAMVHHPRVLFLDEPTTGLDPVARQNVWERLRELRTQSGTTIFFSTHNMEEAADVADQVAIMNAGKIIATGSVDDLIRRTGKPDATLEDAFIFLTGNNLRETSSFHDTRQARQTERRLG